LHATVESFITVAVYNSTRLLDQQDQHTYDAFQINSLRGEKETYTRIEITKSKKDQNSKISVSNTSFFQMNYL
jgi:hypothetical protein